VLDEAATVQPLYYDPFGGRVNTDGSPFTGTIGDVREGFTGQRHDDHLGLIDMNSRMYDPATQRFLTGDPLVGDAYSGAAWNPYSYVLNDPTNLTDPTGMIWSDCANAPYMPECNSAGGGFGGGTSWGAYGGGGGGGYGGGYNDSVFNPSFGDTDDGWFARQFQRDMADFFHAAEAYGDGGIRGLAQYEKGSLGRELAGLESEWGPGGFMGRGPEGEAVRLAGLPRHRW
jgi:RHS repeat-associated protein